MRPHSPMFRRCPSTQFDPVGVMVQSEYCGILHGSAENCCDILPLLLQIVAGDVLLVPQTLAQYSVDCCKIIHSECFVYIQVFGFAA